MTYLGGQTFFPNAIASSFTSDLDLTSYIGTALSVVAAIASLLRDKKYTYVAGGQAQPVPTIAASKPKADRAASKTNQEDVEV